MKHKTAVKKLMGYGVSRNEANRMLMLCRRLGFPNRFAIEIYRVSRIATMATKFPKQPRFLLGVDFSYSTEETK